MFFDPSKPFEVPFLPPAAELQRAQFVESLLAATEHVAELKGLCASVPNSDLFVAPLLAREAVASSAIENIHTTVADFFRNDLFPEVEQRPPDKEVLRYREAVLWGAKELGSLPISSRIITGLVGQLLPNGSGRFRQHQNQISDTTKREPVYTPPPPEAVPRLIANWEQFVNEPSDGLDPFIKCAVAHYQFEAIHPFDDGNGRVGRILMVLQLVQSGRLNRPVLFISRHINQYRSRYYQLLRGVTTENAWAPLIEFLLQGFASQAEATKRTLLATRALHEATRDRVRSEMSGVYSSELVAALFSHPIVTPGKLAEVIGVHRVTASRQLSALAEHGLLVSQPSGRYAFFVNQPLLDILQQD